VEMGNLTILHVSLGVKIGDLHAKGSNLFRDGLIAAAAIAFAVALSIKPAFS